MAVAMGALPSLLPKLGELLVGEYKLQKGVKEGIRILKAELEGMYVALERMSMKPPDQLDNQDKIWATKVKELAYDIEDNVDALIVHAKDSDQAKQHGFKKFVDRSLDLLAQATHRPTGIRDIRSRVEEDIRDLISRVKEVAKLRDRYKIDNDVARPVTLDPRLLAHFTKATELVGIDEARDELIKILMEGNEVSMQQGKIVSIVGFGGLGKTTLASAVCEKLRAQFDCWAFVSVSRTPDMKKLFKDMLYQLGKENNASITQETLESMQLIIYELREYLQNKRYFIVIDDICDILDWEMIRCALPDNSGGYRIITTTCISSVAKQADVVYKMQPLCLHSSRVLLFRRIFGTNDKGKCPDEELAEVSDRILKKCAGVPQAIIMIASLLASKERNEMEWYKVYDTIGTGLVNSDNSLDLRIMRLMLSASYYDMPIRLRTCLLYLSLFPEDCHIHKDRLIWLWIAEGFINCGEQGKSLFEIGESYFYELMNRSMIQPVVYKSWYFDMTEYCRVNVMVLDLLCSLSSEENFITILNGVHHTFLAKRVRRLSLQNSMMDHATLGATMNMQHVRSVVVFPSAVNLMPALPSFRVLRVLDLQDCCLSQGCTDKGLGSLFHLRYLGLRGTRIVQLPEEIGSLQFLQTLDVTGNEISRLPSTVVQLKHLMCLHIDSWTRAPNGLGCLTSLEELSTLCIHDSTDIIEELGYLTELRVLGIDCHTGWKVDNLEKSLVGCLQKLPKVQSLSISFFGECNLDAWVVPKYLRRLELMGCWSSTLLARLEPLHHLDLSFVSIEVTKLQQKDLEILGMLKGLCYLDLEVDHEDPGILGRFVIGANLFPCLVQCTLRGSIGPVVFRKGAMPRLTSLCFTFPVKETREIVNSNGGFDLGLGNLLSLQNVTVSFLSGGSSEGDVEEAEDALRHATEIHPNHPTLLIN